MARQPRPQPQRGEPIREGRMALDVQGRVTKICGGPEALIVEAGRERYILWWDIYIERVQSS